ncbi:MAG TPA: hypothetical protein ENO18_01110 [Caldithrix sp.]|nr:hypothetical protein [Caldithrix sp.]
MPSDQKENRYRGVVENSGDLWDEIGITVEKALWEYCDVYDLFRLTKNDNSKLYYDDDAKTYRLDINLDKFFLELTIDPALGYLPVKSSITYIESNVQSMYSCEEFKQVEKGIWVPFRYTWRTNSSQITVDVKSVKVNIDIPEEKLDFVFPDGTSVDDRIANMRYVVGTADGETSLVADQAIGKYGNEVNNGKTNVVEIQDIQPPEIISNEKLMETSLQANDLLDKKKSSPSSTMTGVALIAFIVLLIILGYFIRRKMKAGGYEKN